MGLRLYLDDVRPTPPGWVGCRWPRDVIAHLRAGDVDVVSLDHGLADAPAASAEGRAEVTGDAVIQYCREMLELHGVAPPELRIHSDNPSGIRSMRQGIARLRERSRELGLQPPSSGHMDLGLGRGPR